MLNKKYIKLNTSNYAIFVFIVKKSKKKLKMCVNYRAFNAFIIKNRNASSLIKNILTKFCVAKYFSKFDIITTFNEIKMRKKNEKKIAFLTRYELFEYVIMFFDFCNVSRIFQSFINVILHEYLNDFCINYLNDIFIYFNTREKHVVHVFKILQRFKKTNLYLDINKCEFFIKQVKYLNLIITIENVKMNSTKINVIIN